MKAYLDKTFSKGFLISEENIIKLDDIIHKRLLEHKLGCAVMYKVYRVDSLVFETDDHKQLLAEENSARNAMTRIEVSCKDENINFTLEFDKLKKTHLLIEAQEKDLAYLLFSDVKDYLTPEVLRFRSFRFSETKLDRLLFPIMMMVILFASIYMGSHEKLDESGFKRLISQGTMEAKINYMLQQSRNRININRLWYLTVGLIVLMIVSTLALEALDRAFPVNIFYMGKEVARVDRMKEVRSRVVWGVGISLIVSIMGGFVVYWMTKS